MYKRYYTGDPAKRMRGGFAYLGVFAMLGAAIKTTYHLITA